MRRALTPVLVLALTLALSSCSGDATSPATKSEATKSAGMGVQAESVWRAYLSASNKALKDESVDVNIIRPYVTVAHYKIVKKQVDAYRSAGKHLKGELLSNKFDFHGDANGVASAFVCVDNTKSSVLNSDGKRDTEPRPANFTLKLTFVTQAGHLLIDRDQTWTRSSAC